MNVATLPPPHHAHARRASPVAVEARHFGPGNYVVLQRPGGERARLGDMPCFSVVSGTVFAAVPREPGAAPYGGLTGALDRWRILRYYIAQDVVGIDDNARFRSTAYLIARADARFEPLSRELLLADWLRASERWMDTHTVRVGEARPRVEAALRVYAGYQRAGTEPEGVRIRVKLTEISAFIDLSREMVGRILTTLDREGRVNRVGKSAQVLLTWPFLYPDG